MNRGAHKAFIFPADSDKTDFLKLLRTFTQRTGLKVGSYCVMGNHYHVLVQGPGEALTHCFHEVDRLWALNFNGRREGKGHVFQGPFLSFLQVSPGWIVRTSLYIHLNPIGRRFRDPGAYPWSSYECFLGRGRGPQWVDASLVLRHLGDRPSDYRDLLRFRAERLKNRPNSMNEETEIQRGRALELAVSAATVRAKLGVDEDEARRLVALVGWRQGLSPSVLAPALGYSSANLLSVTLFRLRQQLPRNAALQSSLDQAERLANGLPEM
jgi:REP element-mobilizing transposase RayT